MKKLLLLCLALSALQCCAAEPNTPQPTAASGNSNGAAKVDESVLAYRTLDAEVLRRLAKSTNQDVLCGVASNPKHHRKCC